MEKLNYKKTIWINQYEFGTYKIFKHKNKKIKLRIPQNIRKEKTLLLKGIGRETENRVGNLLVRLRLNKGDNITKPLWISESTATKGATKFLLFNGRRIPVIIPSASLKDTIIKIEGLGKRMKFQWNNPLLKRKNGDLFVQLKVFPDTVVPKYESFDRIDIDDIALEGLVYSRIDKIINRIDHILSKSPPSSEKIADLYNENGWIAIFFELLKYLNLNYRKISIKQSRGIKEAGKCKKYIKKNVGLFNRIKCNYEITINKNYLYDPFLVAAILSHELCHVLCTEKLNFNNKENILNEYEIADEEHTVDFLTVVLKLAEFQLQALKSCRIKLGYYNQHLFERIQVFVSKKLDRHSQME